MSVYYFKVGRHSLQSYFFKTIFSFCRGDAVTRQQNQGLILMITHLLPDKGAVIIPV
jgi:hypothetical protein